MQIGIGCRGAEQSFKRRCATIEERTIMAMHAINPATGETLNTYDEITPSEVARRIERAHEAFLDWRQTSFAERATLMRRAARELRDQANTQAQLMALEMGKPIVDGRAEMEKC